MLPRRSVRDGSTFQVSLKNLFRDFGNGKNCLSVILRLVAYATADTTVQDVMTAVYVSSPVGTRGENLSTSTQTLIAWGL